MRLIPSKKVIEEFLLTYELKGCQKAVNLLARYYGIRRMKIVVDGRRVGNGDEACYDYEDYTAYFARKAINRFNALHELYHHIVYVKGRVMSDRKEEKEASRYATKILKKGK